MKRLTTKEIHFSITGDATKNQNLFCVNPYIDAEDTLNSASNFISMVMDILMDAAMGDKPLEGSSAHMVIHTLESAKAALDAVWEKLRDVNTSQEA